MKKTILLLPFIFFILTACAAPPPKTAVPTAAPLVEPTPEPQTGETATEPPTAVDPSSPLNQPGQTQSFAVQLTDRTGATAVVQTRPNEPALAFPPGTVQEDDIFVDGLFTGRAPMTTVRLLLSDFTGVDLTQISEVALLFGQTPSGTLFMGDIELVKP